MEFLASVWEVLAWFFWAFVFVAAFFAFIMVLTDLFRDKNLNGWAKAAWIVFLIFVPLLTCLVYVIARGKGVSERTAGELQRQKEAQDQYIRDVAGVSVADEVTKAKGLLDSGVITQQEFDQLKSHTLQSTG